MNDKIYPESLNSKITSFLIKAFVSLIKVTLCSFFIESVECIEFLKYLKELIIKPKRTNLAVLDYRRKEALNG